MCVFLWNLKTVIIECGSKSSITFDKLLTLYNDKKRQTIVVYFITREFQHQCLSVNVGNASSNKKKIAGKYFRHTTSLRPRVKISFLDQFHNLKRLTCKYTSVTKVLEFATKNRWHGYRSILNLGTIERSDIWNHGQYSYRLRNDCIF